MSILAWLILGLVSGFVASMLVNRSGAGLLMDIVLGIIGAMVGGFLFHLFGHIGITGLNAWSMLVAVIGAVVVLSVAHAMRRAVLA
jgi:uncharacterized membrane protein YeaQ/YmgE (transglycosylase-associated protein family)